MSDIEESLKDVVDKFTRVGNADRAAWPGSRKLMNGAEQGRPPLTAPQVIETIETLTKSAALLEGLTLELSSTLAGRDDSFVQPIVASRTGEEMPIFDRMGYGLLELTRTIESIEREVKRALGAVKP